MLELVSRLIRTGARVLALGVCGAQAAPGGGCPTSVPPATGATTGATLFSVGSFSNIVYHTGFTGQVGTTATWPSEMGWQGDTIDIEFDLAGPVSAQAIYHELTVDVINQFDQVFDLAVLVGPSVNDLEEVHREISVGAGTIVARIPICQFVTGQTNWIRLQGIGVASGFGEAPGIQWNSWSLRTVSPLDVDGLRDDQLQKLTNFTVDLIQPNGLVRDGLALAPGMADFHPATPDAAGFALLALSAADHLGLLADADVHVRNILRAYAGHTPGVTPARSPNGHFIHFMNISTGAPAGGGWDSSYSPISTALLVSGALFAANHFSDDTEIGSLASELRASVVFADAIHPSLDGRVYLSVGASGTGDASVGAVVPWNEFMLVVSLAFREGDPRAFAVAPLWLTPANLPKRSYQGIPTLTDNPNAYASGFWVQQSHFFNADFASRPDFEAFFENQQQADQLYCSTVLGQSVRYGLTAGVSPSGYSADRIADHNNVFSPSAVGGWGDLDTLAGFAASLVLPESDPHYRYGLPRVSSAIPSWVPSSTGAVDHLFLMFGLVETIDPLFFKARLPLQIDTDGDGIADLYDNCVTTPNADQLDTDDNGIGDACESPPCVADFDGSGIVDSDDFFAFLNAFFSGDADINTDGTTNSQDFFDFLSVFFGGCEPVG